MAEYLLRCRFWRGYLPHVSIVSEVERNGGADARCRTSKHILHDQPSSVRRKRICKTRLACSSSSPSTNTALAGKGPTCELFADVSVTCDGLCSEEMVPQRRWLARMDEHFIHVLASPWMTYQDAGVVDLLNVDTSWRRYSNRFQIS